MKFRNRKQGFGNVVDAVAEIERQQAQAESRGRPDLAGSARPTTPGAKAFLVLLLGIAVLVLGTLSWKAFTARTGKEAQPTSVQPKIENILPTLSLGRGSAAAPAQPSLVISDPADESLASEPTNTVTITAALKETVIEDLVTKRRLSSGLQGESEGSGQNPRSETQQRAREPDSGPMSERLKPMKLVAAKAGLLGNRDMLITQGAMIDCIQETKLVSAQAGMLTCYASRDIRSTSGRVVLVDAGTRFVGYQQGVLAQGQPRIAVVWSRLETPNGVIIHLDSPGTGSLGEAGLDGNIDTHFAARFGGAILVSLIGDLGNWASSRGSNNNGSIRFDTTGDAAQSAITTVLDNSINIPPTLYRNQGGRIGIYVARDLDFSSVYTLKAVGG